MKTEIKEILEAVQAGKLSAADALLAIKKEPFEDIGYAKIDLHRSIRQGMPEVIYGAGKHKVLPYDQSQLIAEIIKIGFRVTAAAPDTDTVEIGRNTVL